jgi:hypothetical protein
MFCYIILIVPGELIVNQFEHDSNLVKLLRGQIYCIGIHRLLSYIYNGDTSYTVFASPDIMIIA